MKDQVLAFLSELPLFSQLPQKELLAVVEAVAVKNFAKGEVLFTQGRSKIDGIYILKSGEIELYYARDGLKTQRDTLARGEIFGGIAVLMNTGVSVRTALAVEESRCYVIPVELFLRLCHNFDFFQNAFIDAFARRMLDQPYASIVASSQACHFLAGITPFSFLPIEEIVKIAGELSTEFYPRNTTLFTQGVSVIESLYIIHQGAAERYFPEEERETAGKLMGEGDIFGGISMLINDSIAIRSFKTVEDTHFYVWPKRRFLEVCKAHEHFLAFFTDTFGKRMLDRSYASIVAKAIQPGEGGLEFFNQPVSAIARKGLVSCSGQTTIQSAAEMMSRKRSGSVLIESPDGAFVGIVTDNDLRNKVIAGGVDIQQPVERIMSFPLRTVSAQGLVFEAVMAMMQGKIKHLGVTDGEGVVTGIVTNKDILTAQGQSPLFLIREISMADSVDGLTRQHRLLPGIVHNLISNGAKAANLNRLITTVSDAILNKIVTLALNKHGEPPCPFAFMVMGSEGRKEQTLKTDQDNAIIYQDREKEEKEIAQVYFLGLGETICAWLNEVGYDYCKGGIMAQNPEWCQPLSVWKGYFSSWIRAGEPEDLLSSAIFFDFRCAYGKAELVNELHIFLKQSLTEWPFFLQYMAVNAQRFKPPIGFFRNFIVESKGEHRDSFDIKKTMVPIVDFARIHALQHGLTETNTLERLHRLFLDKAIRPDIYHELEQAYSFLMQQRFARQVQAVINEKTEPDNYINPQKLTRIEQTMLKEIFARIDTLQKEISFGLPGGV